MLKGASMIEILKTSKVPLNLSSKISKATLWSFNLLMLTLFQLSMSFAQASDGVAPLKNQPVVLPDKQWINSGVSIYMTPKGFGFFENNLQRLIENFGVSVTDAYFPMLSFDQSEALGIDQLGLDPEKKGKILNAYKELKTWFNSLPLLQFQPQIRIDEFIYSSILKRFALVTDESLLAFYGKTSGAIMIFEIEASDVNLSAQKIRVEDASQKDLGQIGFDNLKMGLGPLKMKIPLWLNVQKGKLIFEALDSKASFIDSKMELKYDQLLFPEVSIQIGSRHMELKKERVSQLIQDSVPVYKKQILEFFEKLAQSELPKFLNEQSKKLLTDSLEDLSVLLPPGAESALVTPFYWGLGLQKISQNKGVWITLGTFIEDPTLGKVTMPPTLKARSAPKAKDLKISEYDFLMSIDRGFINRILQLTYLRGFLKEVDDGSGKLLKFTEALTVDGLTVSPTKTGALMKVGIHAKVPEGTISGASELVVDDEFDFSVSVIAELLPMPNNQGVEIVLRRIDSDTVWVDPNDMTWLGKLFKDKIYSEVKKEIQKINQDWAAKKQVIPGTLPLPPELFGVKSKILGMNFEDTGQLVLYLAYE